MINFMRDVQVAQNFDIAHEFLGEKLKEELVCFLSTHSRLSKF